MNDQFLYDFQEPPRPEFADALYKRIDKPMKTSSFHMRRFTLGASLAALALMMVLFLSPAARAYAQTLIHQIGNLLISHDPTYAEQYEQKNSRGTPTTSPSASPVAVEWQAPPALSLAEASSQAGFPVAEIKRLPANLTLSARFVSPPSDSDPFTHVTTTYASPDMNLAFSQTSYQPGSAHRHLPAGNAAVEPVLVRGVDGLWIENLRLSTYLDEQGRVALQFANILVWEMDGFEYSLQSTPGLPREEMLAIAESVKP